MADGRAADIAGGPVGVPATSAVTGPDSGHTTPAAATIYQHAASEHDKLLAERLSRRAMGADPQG